MDMTNNNSSIDMFVQHFFLYLPMGLTPFPVILQDKQRPVYFSFAKCD